MTTPPLIRLAVAGDQPDLRRAIVEIQDFERAHHATRCPGEQVADAYLEWMLGQAGTDGVVLVAEWDDSFAGFIAGWIEHTDNLGETADSNRFGYVSDICVLPDYRGQRIAAQLLDSIEQFFRSAGVVRLRINALAANTSARASYERAGFRPYEVLHEKVIAGELTP